MAEMVHQSRGLPGTLWLGTAGAALMVAGMVALLAANWHKVPLWAQVALALTPLVAGWVGYAWLRLRKVESLGAQEVVGVVWAGGVVCALALLGRVLQASSTQLSFCLTVAALLLPVVYAVRATFAWVAACVFLLVALADMSPHFGLCDARGCGSLALLMGGVALLAPRLAWAWRTSGGYARVQRTLAAVASIPMALMLSFWLCSFGKGLACPFLSKPEVPLFLLGASLPLLVGTLAEGRHAAAKERTLSLFGGLFFVVTTLVMRETSRRGMPFLEGAILAGVIAVALVATRRWTLRHEGIFLLLYPITLVHLPLLNLTLTLAVGIWAIVRGVRQGDRADANEGLLVTLWVAVLFFGTSSLSLPAIAGVFLVGGLVMVVLNLLLSRVKQENGHA